MRVHFGVITAHMTAGIGMTASIQGMQGGVTAAIMTGTGSTDMIGAAVIETAACLLRRARADTEMTGCRVVSAQYWQMRMPACPCTQKSAFDSFKLLKYERPTGAATVSLAINSCQACVCCIGGSTAHWGTSACTCKALVLFSVIMNNPWLRQPPVAMHTLRSDQITLHPFQPHQAAQHWTMNYLSHSA